MNSITINCQEIITNKIFLAVISGLIGVICLFLDKCIFIKQVHYFAYIKLFILIFCIVLSVLYFIEKCNITNNTDLTEDLNTDLPNF